jgi:hypothetical protein
MSSGKAGTCQEIGLAHADEALKGESGAWSFVLNQSMGSPVRLVSTTYFHHCE